MMIKADDRRSQAGGLQNGVQLYGHEADQIVCTDVENVHIDKRTHTNTQTWTYMKRHTHTHTPHTDTHRHTHTHTHAHNRIHTHIHTCT